MGENMQTQHNKQAGAVSIFVVIFFALLLSVITLGFVRLMSQDQLQSTTFDLSQSAYDSAEAGVEDAKRALIRYREACGANAGSTECQAFQNAINARECDTLNRLSGQLGLNVNDDGSIRVETTSGDSALQQAYTCVQVAMSTEDYIRRVDANTSDFVPLRGTGNFSSVDISWFIAADAGLGADGEFVLPGTDEDDDYTPPQLPAVEEWGEATPPVMRVQLLQHEGESFNQEGLEQGSSTLFLYPVASGGTPGNEVPFTRYSRGAQSQPIMTNCTEEAGGYACTARLQLTGSLAMTPEKASYLKVTPLYKGSTFRLQLDGGNVEFDGVQPSVDSTGRANDVFRRLDSRIRFDDATGGYPESALETTSDICKDFAVSSEPLTLGSCQPKDL